MTLVLRDEHMRAFEQAMEDSFRHRATKHLLERYPTQSQGRAGPELRGIVGRGTDLARRFGFTTEKQVVGFLEVYYLWGDDFHQKGRAPDILARSDSPEERLRALVEAGYRT